MWQHSMVANALQTGLLIKPDKCSDCGIEDTEAFLEGHHTDYSKPLDVVWLCKPCHLKAHKKIGSKAGRKPKEVKADKTIRVYVTNEQKMALENKCLQSGFSESTLIKQLLRENGII